MLWLDNEEDFELNKIDIRVKIEKGFNIMVLCRK